MRTAPRYELIELVGDVDLMSTGPLAERLGRALASGTPILIDLTDCAYLDLRALKALKDGYREATSLGLGFAVVLPFRGARTVQRLALELAPELASFPIAPDRRTAEHLLERSAVGPRPFVDPRHVRALRARAWRLMRRQEELLAERDTLVLESRAARHDVARAGDAGDERV